LITYLAGKVQNTGTGFIGLLRMHFCFQYLGQILGYLLVYGLTLVYKLLRCPV
jgi:hypothetical protein